ncbi:ATP-dependent DNA ligase domain-containing protein [Ascosphaera apis ARSEF 7405]|uniref:ATP-dependent DNA ligase domain-containing protein n=1 Tax=Ascosphaera apis ARSEF 7405 TaxID=392613 RepID=A0A162IEN8_9EURO|nr:ATP-dependent DNA ligase domain-containing protein [Ascosphaera apis ARSEF 7405]
MSVTPDSRGFKFSYICDLFDELEHNRVLKSTTTGRVKDLDGVVISRWFNRHRPKIFAPSTDKLALLSCILPTRRPDRVLGLGPTALSRIIGRCLLLGSSRISELNLYKYQGNGDLGQCLENVLRQTDEGRDGSGLTVEDINGALDKIGAKNRFSSPELRNRVVTAADIESILGCIVRRVQSREGKWLIRVILKDQITALVPENIVFKNFHFLFPHILSVRGSLQQAVRSLDTDPICTLPSNPEAKSQRALVRLSTPHLVPLIGCKVGRPPFLKARSIEHCSNLIGRRWATVQRKYDGEYFQAHIDCTKCHQGEITIFSKSGKDSTSDRVKIHELIRKSLRLDRADHTIRKCILEGELLVWSEREQDILPFYHIRKHITRRGVRLGADGDSQPEPWEHLYVVFFDILQLNEHNCLAMPLKERRTHLLKTIQCVPGSSALAEYRDIDFSQEDAADGLRAYFAHAISNRWEGLVLKHLDGLYNLSGRKPVFRVVSCLDHHNLPANVSQALNTQGQFIACAADSKDPPFVVKYDHHSQKERISYSNGRFERPHNVNYWALRFPRVTKIHQDRNWQDALTFEQLQDLAQEAMFTSTDVYDDMDAWNKKLGAPENETEADSETVRSQDSSQETISLLLPQTRTEVQFGAVVQQTGPPSLPSSQPQHIAITAAAEIRLDVHGKLEGIIMPEQDIASSASHSAAAISSHDSQEYPLPPFFSAHPIFLGTSVSNPNPCLQRCLQKTSECTSSLPKFLDAAISLEHRAVHSKPVSDECRGIILVDTDKALAGRAAADISNMGNAIAARRKSGMLRGAGYFIVLDWRIIDLFPKLAAATNKSLGSDEGRAAEDEWLMSAKRFYAGRLKWREEGPRRLGGVRSGLKRRKLSHIDTGSSQTLVPSSIPASPPEPLMHTSESDVLYDTRDLEMWSHCISS